MDTSKEYLKMCEKAVEIQKVRTIFPSTHDVNEIGHINCTPTGDFAYSSKEKFIWLPRQDQLLDMITHTFTLHRTAHFFVLENGHIKKEDTGEILGFRDRSMEKVLLKFLMFFYHKTWTGEDWI